MCGDIPPSILAVQIYIIDGNPWTSLLKLVCIILGSFLCLEM